MSSTNAETTTTDNTETEKQPNIYNFITYIILTIIVIIIYVSCGGFILYGCKLAQSNILPTYLPPNLGNIVTYISSHEHWRQCDQMADF